MFVVVLFPVTVPMICLTCLRQKAAAEFLMSYTCELQPCVHGNTNFHLVSILISTLYIGTSHWTRHRIFRVSMWSALLEGNFGMLVNFDGLLSKKCRIWQKLKPKTWLSGSWIVLDAMWRFSILNFCKRGCMSNLIQGSCGAKPARKMAACCFSRPDNQATQIPYDIW